MKTVRSYKQTQERHFSAHHMLLEAAEEAFLEAKEKQPGWFNQALVAMTFSAFAIEAMGNAYGSQLIPEWRDFESANPYAKVRLVAEHLGVSYEEGKEPWATLRWLGRFRNSVAHARPESISNTRFLSQVERDQQSPFDMPMSEMEKQITIEGARRAVNAVQQAKKLLYGGLRKDNHQLLLFSDGWSESTELQ